MEALNDLVKALPIAPRALVAQPTKGNVTLKPNPPRPPAMRRLWERMSAMYGHRWASAYGVQSEDEAGKPTLAGDSWGRSLAGISEHQIAQGLSACLTRGGDHAEEGWPPSAPQFRRMCLGIPSIAEFRFDMRLNTVHRNPFTRLAWSYIDSHRYRLADAASADRMLRDAYELACEYVLRGEPLPDCAGVIDAPVEQPVKPASPEVVALQMSKLAEVLGDEE